MEAPAPEIYIPDSPLLSGTPNTSPTLAPANPPLPQTNLVCSVQPVVREVSSGLAVGPSLCLQARCASFGGGGGSGAWYKLRPKSPPSLHVARVAQSGGAGIEEVRSDIGV